MHKQLIPGLIPLLVLQPNVYLTLTSAALAYMRRSLIKYVTGEILLASSMCSKEQAVF